jgi:uncharacterized protein (DUF433 family)
MPPWTTPALATRNATARLLASVPLQPYLSPMADPLLDRITVDPDQCHGRPCVRGMRIRVQDVVGMLAAGWTEADILEEWPELEREDMRAALAYAARELDLPAAVAAA